MVVVMFNNFDYWNKWEVYKNNDTIHEMNKMAKNLTKISEQLALVSLDLDKLLDILIKELKEVKKNETL